jgi:hypothetical protein
MTRQLNLTLAAKNCFLSTQKLQKFFLHVNQLGKNLPIRKGLLSIV